MNKIQLALIGKNILHSKSKLVYENLLQREIHYDLIDVKDALNLPTLESLSKNYNGVSLTTPYKENYLKSSDLSLDSLSKNLNAINCIRFQQKIEGTNTDYLGIRDLLRSDFGVEKRKVIILGDGTMARIVKFAAREFKLEIEQYSRKIYGDLTFFNFRKSYSDQSKLLFINCCDRKFTFQGELPADSWFWDMNYDFTPHLHTIPNKCERYIDGTSLLIAQATHAIQFWGIK